MQHRHQPFACNDREKQERDRGSKSQKAASRIGQRAARPNIEDPCREDQHESRQDAVAIKP